MATAAFVADADISQFHVCLSHPWMRKNVQWVDQGRWLGLGATGPPLHCRLLIQIVTIHFFENQRGYTRVFNSSLLEGAWWCEVINEPMMTHRMSNG